MKNADLLKSLGWNNDLIEAARKVADSLPGPIEHSIPKSNLAIEGSREFTSDTITLDENADRFNEIILLD